jgi:hypothetical protein
MTPKRRRWPSLLEDDAFQHVDSDDSDVETDEDLCGSCGEKRGKHPWNKCETFVEEKL